MIIFIFFVIQLFKADMSFYIVYILYLLKFLLQSKFSLIKVLSISFADLGQLRLTESAVDDCTDGVRSLQLMNVCMK